MAAKYTEATHQACAVRGLRKIEAFGYQLSCAGDMNAGKRGAKAAVDAKMTGLTPGEPDLRVYCEGGELVSFEIKTEKGSVSKAQRERHEILNRLGFDVYVVKHEEPLDTAIEIGRIVASHMLFDEDEFDSYMTKATNEILAAMATGVQR